MARLKIVEDTPSEVKYERHSRNIQVFKHGICIGANRLINSILNQIFHAEDNDPGGDVQ